MRPSKSWQRARVTLAIAGVTAFAWLAVSLLGYDQLATYWGGFIPARAGGVEGDEALAPFFLTPLTATLVHAGIIHLAFNLLMLLFCGRSVENILGAAQFLILYVAGAFAGAAAQYLAGPEDMVPMVGASGAISAVLGAYSMLFGRNKIRVSNPQLALWLNALWLAAAWIGLQLIVGVTYDNNGARVAIAAHIGGFIAGLLLVKPLLLVRYRGA